MADIPDNGISERNGPPDTKELAERIIALAHKGSIVEAEALRSQLMEVAPMAIEHIVATAEIIEEEKTKRLDPEHLAAWSELYETLNEEDTNQLFYSLKQARVDAGKLLLAQGKPNSRLFFIEEGNVTLFYRQKEKNLVAGNLERGSILGEDSFFGISLCPFSAATKTDCTMRYLTRKQAEGWRQDKPQLYGILAEYCQRIGIGEMTAEQKSSGRREFRRYPVSGSAVMHVLDKDLNKTAVYFRGELNDMSRSGVCFSIHCSRQDMARALLMKNIAIAIEFDDRPDETFTVGGTIVKLSYRLHSDYHVHVKLSEIITIERFKTFPCDWSAEEKF